MTFPKELNAYSKKKTLYKLYPLYKQVKSQYKVEIPTLCVGLTEALSELPKYFILWGPFDLEGLFLILHFHD